MNAWQLRQRLIKSGSGAALALLIGVSCMPLARADTASELEDAAARMQYAFYTADSRGLEEVLTVVAGLEAAAAPGMQQYYAAYGNWKLSQLYADAQAAGKAVPRSSAKTAQECQRQAKAAIAVDPRMAEAHAIEAICSGNCGRSKSLRTALELDAQNPRIRLIELMCVDKDEANSAANLQRLQALVASFEGAPPARPGTPDWGQAEALVLLGQSFLQRGDPVAARDAIERALVVAPDYQKAQELLQRAAVQTH